MQNVAYQFLKRTIVKGATAAILACGLMAGAAYTADQAWAQVDPGVYTATAIGSYSNPDDGSIADSGGSSNETLGQSMVEGLVQPEALVENDGKQELITVRFGQASMISDVRVAADVDHDGVFDEAVTCERVQDGADGKTADWRFSAEDDAATFKFSVYVEPMGRDVNFFVSLGNPIEGNGSGFVQTVTDADIQANLAKAEEKTASSASASDAGADASSNQATSTDSSSDSGLNMSLIIGLIVAAVVILVVVAYFAAIRPGKVASREAAEKAARREKYKN